MKLFIFTFLIFFMFSCAGTPKPGEDTPDSSQPDSSVEKIDESPVQEDSDNALLSEEQTQVDENSAGIEQEEIAGTGIADDLLPKEETAAVEVSVQDEPTVDAAAIEPPPVVEPLSPPPQVPAQITQEPAPAPRPAFPPSLPPPALLGPAEEKPPASDQQTAAENQPQQRQGDVPPGVTPPVVSAVRDDSSFPFRSEIIVPRNEEIIFSRIVRATVGQIVEIPFRGTGWIFIGEIASRRGIVFSSRRFDPEGQSFVFRAEEAGAYVLKFYRQDFIRDYILNDHVQVIVGEAPDAGGAGWFSPPIDRGRVTAQPRWPSALDEAAIQKGGSGSRPAASDSSEVNNSGAVNNSDVSQTLAAPSEPIAYVEPAPGRVTQRPAQETSPAQGDAAPSLPAPARDTVPARPQDSVMPQNPAAPQAAVTLPSEKPADNAVAEKQENLPPEVILQKAKETFDGGNAAAAIALLDQYAQIFPGGTDELYWYYGQFYEANTPSRNILLSLDYYRRLVNEYPQSSRLNDARRRIAYLERFYINIQ